MGRGGIRPNAEADSVAVLEITSIPTASGSFRLTEKYPLPADRIAENGGINRITVLMEYW
jgi:hypothetical protein